MSVLLEIKGLSAGYGRIPVLHGVECNVHDNEILGILGNNGMGKSTLLKTVMGIISPTSGTIRRRFTLQGLGSKCCYEITMHCPNKDKAQNTY